MNKPIQSLSIPAQQTAPVHCAWLGCSHRSIPTANFLFDWLYYSTFVRADINSSPLTLTKRSTWRRTTVGCCWFASRWRAGWSAKQRSSSSTTTWSSYRGEYIYTRAICVWLWVWGVCVCILLFGGLLLALFLKMPICQGIFMIEDVCAVTKGFVRVPSWIAQSYLLCRNICVVLSLI